MTKVKSYIGALSDIRKGSQAPSVWDEYLRAESGLPGPRGNLELMSAVAELGSEDQFLHLLSFTADIAPVNTPEEFLHCCGAVGLGRLLSEGRTSYLDTLRRLASDPRWRTREAVAMALQFFGERNMEDLLDFMEEWADGNEFERRAAAAALCEPRLLKNKEHAARVLAILDRITASISVVATKDPAARKSEDYRVLRKGMAYCWSVAIAAYPEAGKPLFEKWAASTDEDVRWILIQNLQKERLRRADPEWTEKMKATLQVRNRSDRPVRGH